MNNCSYCADACGLSNKKNNFTMFKHNEFSHPPYDMLWVLSALHVTQLQFSSSVDSVHVLT